MSRRSQKKNAKVPPQKAVAKTTSGLNPGSSASPDPQSNKKRIVAAGFSFSGPIPHPSILLQYNEVVPDAATRILGMAERQEAHRQHLEKAVIESDIRRADRGLSFAFIVAAMCVVGSVGLIAIGRGIEGLTTLFGAIGSLAGLFIYTQRTRKRERTEGRGTEEQEGPKQMPLPLR